MSLLTLSATADILDRSFSLVEKNFEQDISRDGLKSAGLSTLQVAIEETWLKVKSLCNTSYEFGFEKMQDKIKKVNTFIARKTSELGRSSKEFLESIQQRIMEMINNTFEMILRNARSEIVVGERTLCLTAVELEQKIIYSGSIELNLSALCKFVGSGGISVKVTYSTGDE